MATVDSSMLVFFALDEVFVQFQLNPDLQLKQHKQIRRIVVPRPATTLTLK